MDICESAVYSWLKHVKKCQVIEVNWKPSKEWTICEEKELDNIMAFCSEHFKNNYGFNLIDKQSLGQKLKQIECDVMGIKHSAERIDFYAVETAFHAEGLYYTEGKLDGTVKKVVQKLISLALCLKGFFNTNNGEIYFTSPHATKTKEMELNKYVNELQDLFIANGYNYKFKLLFDAEFNNEIIKPIRKLKKRISDSHEAFARAGIILDMMKKFD